MAERRKQQSPWAPRNFHVEFASYGVDVAASQVSILSVVKSRIYAADYVDGAVQRTYSAPSADLRALAARFAVGNTVNFSDNGFHGQIAEILIYNRALSELSARRSKPS